MAGYSNHSIMDLGRLTYNNLTEDRFPKPKSKDNGEEKNYLALTTVLMARLSSQKNTPVDQ